MVCRGAICRQTRNGSQRAIFRQIKNAAVRGKMTGQKIIHFSKPPFVSFMSSACR